MEEKPATMERGKERIRGVHHVTAVAGDPQRNVDFYAGTLGLKMVKRTVNFDAPDTLHLYYAGRGPSGGPAGGAAGGTDAPSADHGERGGTAPGAAPGPGRVLTFFPWPTARAARRGRGGFGRVAFSVPEGSLEYWWKRLEQRGLDVRRGGGEAGRGRLELEDPDGLPLALVEAGDTSARFGSGQGTPEGPADVPAGYAVGGVAWVTLVVGDGDATDAFLREQLGLERIGDEPGVAAVEERVYRAPGTGPGRRVRVAVDPDAPPARDGRGAVHHVAWRAGDEDSQRRWRRRLRDAGYDPTPPVDRHYFRSVYLRGPEGLRIEFATEGPGFTLDEAPGELGTRLCLPPWLEARREEIEAGLPELDWPDGG